MGVDTTAHTGPVPNRPTRRVEDLVAEVVEADPDALADARGRQSARRAILAASVGQSTGGLFIRTSGRGLGSVQQVGLERTDAQQEHVVVRLGEGEVAAHRAAVVSGGMPRQRAGIHREHPSHGRGRGRW